MVILDYEMPGIDGLTLIGEVRRLRSCVAVFLISSHDESSGYLETEALARGAIDFVPKPKGDDSALAVRHLIINCLDRAGRLPDRLRSQVETISTR